MFTYSLPLKLNEQNTLQNLTNSKFTQIFSKNKLQFKLKKMFRITYFDNSGKRVCEEERFCLFWWVPSPLADFPIETGAPYMGKSARGESQILKCV